MKAQLCFNSSQEKRKGRSRLKLRKSGKYSLNDQRFRKFVNVQVRNKPCKTSWSYKPTETHHELLNDPPEVVASHLFIPFVFKRYDASITSRRHLNQTWVCDDSPLVDHRMSLAKNAPWIGHMYLHHWIMYAGNVPTYSSTMEQIGLSGSEMWSSRNHRQVELASWPTCKWHQLPPMCLWNFMNLRMSKTVLSPNKSSFHRDHLYMIHHEHMIYRPSINHQMLDHICRQTMINQ